MPEFHEIWERDLKNKAGRLLDAYSAAEYWQFPRTMALLAAKLRALGYWQDEAGYWHDETSPIKRSDDAHEGADLAAGWEV